MVQASHISDEIKEYLLKQNDMEMGEECSEEGECFMVYNYIEINEKKVLAFRRLRPKALPKAVVTRVNLQTPSSLSPENLDISQWKVDKTTVFQAYGRTHILSGYFSEALDLDSENKQKILMIGLGGGTISNFLSTIDNVETTVIELEPVFLKIAEKYFGHQDIIGKTKTYLMNGVEFLRETVEKEEKYRSIILDACYGQDVTGSGQLGPVKEFMDQKVIRLVYDALEETGVCSINTISVKNREINEKLTLEAYSKIFPSCYLVPIFPHQNMLICSKRENWSWNEQRERFKKNLQSATERFGFDALDLLLDL